MFRGECGARIKVSSMAESVGNHANERELPRSWSKAEECSSALNLIFGEMESPWQFEMTRLPMLLKII